MAVGVDGGEPGSKTIVPCIPKYVWRNRAINILNKLFGVDRSEPGSKTIVPHILKYMWLNCTI